MTLLLYQNLLHHVLQMLRRVRFVLPLMTLPLRQNHGHQTVLKQVQNYVVKNHHQKMGQIQGTTVTEMVMIMGMEKIGQTEMETTTRQKKVEDWYHHLDRLAANLLLYSTVDIV
jgi:hypothetical protein